MKSNGSDAFYRGPGRRTSFGGTRRCRRNRLSSGGGGDERQPMNSKMMSPIRRRSPPLATARIRCRFHATCASRRRCRNFRHGILMQHRLSGHPHRVCFPREIPDRYSLSPTRRDSAYARDCRLNDHLGSSLPGQNVAVASHHNPCGRNRCDGDRVDARA